MLNIMKSIRHVLLEGGPNIFKDKWKLLVSEGTPWENGSGFVLIRRENVDLIIARKSIHEGKYNTCGIVPNDLVNEGDRIVILWTISVEIPIKNRIAEQ